MRFTYAEDAAPRARAPTQPGLVRRALIVTLIALAGLVAFELVSFVQDYWRALHG